MLSAFRSYAEVVRASRLIELLLLLQMRGAAPAAELARELEVSVRTVYRDVEALGAAGVPIYTEVGRHGGIRLAEDYRAGGLPRLDDGEARAMLLAAVPSAARDLGLRPEPAAQKLLAALDRAGEAAARSVRERVLVEPEAWWGVREETPFLLDVARAVWEGRELRIGYRDRDERVRPLGLVLKAGTWYLVGRRGRSESDRIYRLSRVTSVVSLPHRFERPAPFDLAGAWEARKEAFAAAIPTCFVTVRVSPAAIEHLPLLAEGTPPLPLSADVERDSEGWLVLRLRFERPDSAARLLLQLGADVEVLDPPEVRERVAVSAAALHAMYR